MTTLRRIGVLAAPPPRQTALAVALGVVAVACGVGLMTSAGYLISRAAEQPPILSLTVTIVVVRFFGLARPVARYLERLSSHDAALRTLGRIRARFFERIEPLAPSALQSYRSGDLLARMVGDGGRPLSAGERQRLALARAFLRDAPVAILDEPTANLDPESAELVADAVERLSVGRTVLLIAHAPELAALADHVVELRGGRIATPVAEAV